MNRSVPRPQVGLLLAQAGYASVAALRGSIVDDPEDPAGVVIGGLGHDLGDQAVKGGNPGRLLTATQQFEAMNIEGSQTSPGAAAILCGFHLDGGSGLGREGGRLSAGLDTGLLIRREDELVVSKQLPFPDPFIPVQDAHGFAGELRMAGKDPAAMLPRSDGLFM